MCIYNSSDPFDNACAEVKSERTKQDAKIRKKIKRWPRLGFLFGRGCVLPKVQYINGFGVSYFPVNLKFDFLVTLFLIAAQVSCTAVSKQLTRKYDRRKQL